MDFLNHFGWTKNTKKFMSVIIQLVKLDIISGLTKSLLPIRWVLQIAIVQIQSQKVINITVIKVYRELL